MDNIITEKSNKDNANIDSKNEILLQHNNNVGIYLGENWRKKTIPLSTFSVSKYNRKEMQAMMKDIREALNN